MYIPTADFIILGIDTSTKNWGYGLIAVAPSGDMQYLDSGVWNKSPKGSDWLDRADHYADHLDEYMSLNHFDMVAIEAPYIMRNPRVGMQLSIVYGIAQRTIRTIGNADGGYKPMEIEPKLVKQLVTGKGNADKPLVAQFVLARLGIDHKFKTDDESDALAVAIAAAAIQQSHDFGTS